MAYTKHVWTTNELITADKLNHAESGIQSNTNALTSLQSTVDSISAQVGTPLVATTISAMIDYNKIYVYTGSETGYTNGHWYYWNGATWADGGVYNAVAVQTDTTLSMSGMAADAKATGDGLTDLKNVLNNAEKLNDLNWTIGSLISGTGAESVSSTRIRSPFISVVGGETVELSGTANCLIVYCYNSNYGYMSESTWTDGNHFSVPSGTGNIRILIRKNASNATISAGDVATLAAQCTLYRVLPKDVYDFDLDSIENVKNSLRLDGDIDLISGGRRINETVQSVTFTWNADKTSCTVNGTNSSSSAQARQVFAGGVGAAQLPEGLVPGEKYYVSCTSTNVNVGLSFYFYINGTWNSVQYFTGNGILDIPSSATGIDVAIAVRPSQTVSNAVVSNIALQKFPAESAVKDRTLGFVGTNTYKTVQNTSHSSTNNQVTGTFKAGESYIVRLSANTETSFEWQVFISTGKKVGQATTGTANGNQVLFTLDTDATTIGIYTPALNVAPFQIVYSVEKSFLKSSVFEYDDLNNYGLNSFYTTINTGHSSASDQVVGSFKAGKSYIVRMNADTSTAFEWQVFAFASGTGTKVATANTGTLNGDQVRFTLDADADAIGVYTAPVNEASFKVSFAVEKPEPSELSVDDYDYDTKVREFAAKFNNTGAVDSFVWFTDPHLMKAGDTPSIYSNFLYYTGVIGGFYDRTPTQFALCGGDWIQWWDTQALACFKLGWITGRMKELFGDRYYTAVGNHDTDEQGTAPVWLSDSTIRNVMMPREDATYYSFEATNSRFYVLNTDTDHQTDMIYTDGRGTHNRWTQVEWLGNQLKTNDDTHAVICMHIGWGGSGDPWTVHDYLDPFADYVQQLIGAYNSHGTITLNNTAYNFSTCSGKVGCILCGHIHDDKDNTTSYSVPVVATPNTQNGGVPTFDLVLIDWTANKMEMVRVGTGSNRSYTLA